MILPDVIEGKDVETVERFRAFLMRFEQSGEVDGVAMRLSGISVEERVAMFVPVDGGKSYFFDAKRMPEEDVSVEERMNESVRRKVGYKKAPSDEE